ncbi:MAG: hypothetical protein L6Q73_06360 [Aquabacterium sp.]|nr:hypothetical protein [Aquabacterium sp.]
MNVRRKPARWSGSDEAIRAVQVAFDVEQAVLEAVRTAAFHNRLSTSDQIRRLLDLPTTTKPVRPRLTVSLNAEDYLLLAARFGLDPEDRLGIKEQVAAELMRFASSGSKLGRGGPG